jgi:hypothetical protein
VDDGAILQRSLGPLMERIRLCKFWRVGECQTFTCHCTEREALAALNFIRFLD